MEVLDVIKLIVPPLLTLIVGSFWLNRLFVARANLASLVERICNALDELRDDCAAYWSVAYSDANQAEQNVLEAKIKGRLQQISSLLELVADKRPDFPAPSRTLMVTLVDACSGGDFESKKRIADKGRFMKIVSTIYKLAVSLQRLKIWTDGLGRFIDDECHPNQLRSNQDDDAI